MDDHNDDEENQIHPDMDNEEENSDSDGGMEVDCTDDDGDDDIDDKLDSELVDSDVNVEATELTNSDVDLSDESDVKGDLTSDADSNVDQLEKEVDGGSVVDSEEETFALEMKDSKEDDSGDDRYVNDQVDLKNNSPIKSISEDEAKVEKKDKYVEGEKKSTAVSDDTNTLHESTNNVESNKDESSSAKVIQKDEQLEDEDALLNGDSPTSTRHNSEEEPNTNASNIVHSPKTSLEVDGNSHLVHDTNEQNNNTSPKRNERIVTNDDAPKFIGFDSEITNKTMQILYILQQNYQELCSQLRSVPDENDKPSAMEVELQQCSQLNDTSSEHSGPNRHETTAVGEISPREKQHADEQGTANKRIKKKRKFFDEFDENDMDTVPKKAKEQRDSTPNVDANMSENKENFMSSEKPHSEDELSVVIPPIPSSVMPSTPNPPTKLETKGKFDITNPDFKEPFKYGWKREVVYRFISEDGQKKSADVSYFTPEGKKLRSIKQINENLPEDGSLHIKNFTFSKELVFRNRESELEVTRFTKKMEAELRTNESPNVSSDHIIDRRLGIEPISTSISLPSASVDPSRAGDDTAKKTSTVTPTSSSSKKKEAQKSKVNVKSSSASLSHSSDTTSKSKSSSKKGAKNIAMETDAEESTNATPKLTMPKIMLRGPNVANSNVAASKVTSSGMKIKIASIPSKQNSQKTVSKKAPSSSKSNSKNSKSQKRPDKSSTIDSQVGTVLVSDTKNRDRSSSININGRSPNELGTYQTATSIRVPSELSSSFTLSNISRIYEPLLMSLKYLTVRDLLRVSMTCKFLHRIASESCLWKTVRLKNSHVHDWKGFAQALQKYGTKRLDMRKMLCSSVPEELNKMWQEFLEVVPSITSLEHIDFSRTPMNVIDTVAATCPNLAVFNALYLKNGSLTLDNFTRLQHLVELKLKGFGGIDLKRNNPQLHFINKDNLRELSLTCIKNIDMDLLTMICEASNLVTLELGECAQLPSDFANEIGKLKKLEKLRLEKLENLAPDYELLKVVNSMKTLKSLELINIEIKDGFDEVLAQCKNVENFLIIPLYLSQSATTNQLVLDGIKGLSDTLKCFVWGLTIELLKVTDLFMDQWQPKSSNAAGPGGPGNAANKKPGESIPVRKLVDKSTSDGDAAPTHVDILPVPKLERILATNLPKSRIKVIKIPFQMTWRQSLSECLK